MLPEGPSRGATLRRLLGDLLLFLRDRAESLLSSNHSEWQVMGRRVFIYALATAFFCHAWPPARMPIFVCAVVPAFPLFRRMMVMVEPVFFAQPAPANPSSIPAAAASWPISPWASLQIESVRALRC
jgi:hypothetical protein